MRNTALEAITSSSGKNSMINFAWVQSTVIATMIAVRKNTPLVDTCHRLVNSSEKIQSSSQKGQVPPKSIAHDSSPKVKHEPPRALFPRASRYGDLVLGVASLSDSFQCGWALGGWL